MADQKIKIMSLATGTPVDTDWIPFVDVSDTTQSPEWSTKRALKSELKWDKGDTWDTWPVWPTGATGATGATWPTWPTWNGIASITLISTVWLVKTYRITYTDTTTFDYTVTDGTNGTNGTNWTNGVDWESFIWCGAYSGATAYALNDVVSYNWSSYICILASTGNLPTNVTYWAVMALKGADGVGAWDMLASVYDPAGWARQVSFACTTQTAITDYTFTGSEARDSWYLVTTASNRTVNISADLFTTGYEVTICKGTNNANTVTIDAQTGNNINGSQTFVLTQYNEVVTLLKDGADTWKIKSHYYPITGVNTGDETTSTIWTLINGSTEQATPADTDRFALSVSSVLRYATWANIKAGIKTYYDSVTATLTNKTLTSPVINTPTGIVKWDVGLGNVDNTSDATKNSATATLTNKTLTSPVVNVGSDATWDIYYRNAGWQLARLPAGTDWQVLNLASGIPEWTTPGGGWEWTLIETLTPSGVTSFDSSTFTAYDKLRVEMDITPSSASTGLAFRMNWRVATNYYYRIVSSTSTQVSNQSYILINSFSQWWKMIWEIMMAGKWAKKPVTASISQMYNDQRLLDWTHDYAPDITQLNFIRYLWAWTFTWTVKIYWKNY